jgi:hypothetical protein
MNDKKLERPLYLDLPFAEALARYAQTKPEEVEPANGRKRKGEAAIEEAHRPARKPPNAPD